MDIPRNPVIIDGIELPYRAGVKIGEDEANFLNKKVTAFIKKATKDGTEFSMETAAASHFFPPKVTRTPGLRSDPSWVFALELITEKIKAKLVEQEKVLSQREITALAKEAVKADPELLEKAKAIWTQRGKLMDSTEIEVS